MMLAIEAQYDGMSIRLPDECKGRSPCRVIVVFEPPENDEEQQQWLEIQEQSLATAWDDEEDGIYDQR